MMYSYMARHWPSRLSLVSLFAVLLYFTIIHKASAGCRTDNTSDIECSGRGTCVHGECECDARANPEEDLTVNVTTAHVRGSMGCFVLAMTMEFVSVVDVSASADGLGLLVNVNNLMTHVLLLLELELLEKYALGKTCPGLCQELLECVKCQVYKTGILTEEECAANCTFVPAKVDAIKANEEKDERICLFYDDDDCRFAFVYAYDEAGKVYVRAQKEKECFLNLHF